MGPHPTGRCCCGCTNGCWPCIDASLAPPLPARLRRRDGLVLIINPQWVTEGNVVSDLGFLPWAKKANEELVASFGEVGGRAGGAAGAAWWGGTEGSDRGGGAVE